MKSVQGNLLADLGPIRDEQSAAHILHRVQNIATQWNGTKMARSRNYRTAGTTRPHRGHGWGQMAITCSRSSPTCQRRFAAEQGGKYLGSIGTAIMTAGWVEQVEILKQ